MSQDDQDEDKQQSPRLHASPAPMSESLISPEPDPIPITSRQSSGLHKRKFVTVESTRPTPAKKRTLRFLEGDYSGSDSGHRSPKLKQLIKKAVEFYNYDDCPLPKDHIRLLFLKPSNDPDGDIVIELQAYPIKTLVSNPEEYQFTALSYNWGEGEEGKVVFVDTDANSKDPPPKPDVGDVSAVFKRRMRKLHIKPNLYEFLRQFRQSKNDVALWADRICINQASNEERQDQVSRMGMIYSTAANVAIWLGTADPERNTDQAMDFIHTILQVDARETLKDKYAAHWSKLLALMRRRWFSRRWVIQELALAKNAEVRCGTKRTHWRDFSDAVSIFSRHFDEVLKIIKHHPSLEKSLEGIKDMTPFGARILVDVLSNTFQRNPDRTVYAPRQGLESLISSLSTFETSDPRDTVYTLLNIAKETCSLPSQNSILSERRKQRSETNPPPVPDYTMDLLEVYTHFVKWCVMESKSLDILCRHWALPELTKKLDKFYPRTVVLPSWITTVRGSAYGPQAEGFGGRRTGDSFVGTPETQCYHASLGMDPDIVFGKHFDEQQATPRELSPESTEQPSRETEQRPGETDAPLGKTALPSGKTITRARRTKSAENRSIGVKGFAIGQVKERHPMLEGVIPEAALNSLGHNSELPELEQIPDSVWRTLVADRGPDGKAPPPWYHRACMNCLASITSGGNMDTNAIMQQEDISDFQLDYLKRVQAVCWNRAFIECESLNSETSKQLVGVGPGKSREGDLVCILYGCSVPCILRETRYDNTRSSFEFIGEAFILGQMDGEAITEFPTGDLERVGQRFQIF